jgi:hypothetical protein
MERLTLEGWGVLCITLSSNTVVMIVMSFAGKIVIVLVLVFVSPFYGFTESYFLLPQYLLPVTSYCHCAFL